MELAEGGQENKGEKNSGVHGRRHRWASDIFFSFKAGWFQAALWTGKKHGLGSRRSPSGKEDSSPKVLGRGDSDAIGGPWKSGRGSTSRLVGAPDREIKGRVFDPS